MYGPGIKQPPGHDRTLPKKAPSKPNFSGKPVRTVLYVRTANR
jgi:hypothetical protein